MRKIKFFLIFFSCTFILMGISHSEEILTLEKAVQIAIKNNPKIKESLFNKRAAMEEKRSAFSDMLPKISAEYKYLHLRDDPFVYFKIGPQENKFVTGYRNTYSWNISLVQPIFTGFALLSKYEISAFGLDREKLSAELTKLDVAFEVKQAYFNVLLARRQLEVMEEEVRQLKSHLDDAKSFYSQGIIPKNDLLKSEVAYSLAKQKLVRAKSDLSVARSNLNRILNKNILDLSYEIQDVDTMPFFSQRLDELIKEAMKKRPEIIAMDRAIKQANWGIKLARSRFFPTVSIFGEYQRQGEGLGATENKFTNEKNLLLGITAKWEFFESGKKFFDVRKAKWRLESLKERKKGLKDQIAVQVKKAYEDLMVAKINVETAKKSLSQARENYRVTNEGYRVQVNTSTDVLDARAYLTQSEMNYYGALYGYHVALAALKRAIGEY
ncbi:TolC family protein [Desulfothermus sp.]